MIKKNKYNKYSGILKIKNINNLLSVLFRFKTLNSYFFNNWFYSTNHKKISINYFWFVLLAGVVGMVLATLIRIEMAYPGIGILAGDNSQYLSIVSAHGVIMVFFMAMPLLFGFFTNFLLPTQLGVHDVAFPRMNSAAFWFLPASLIVLCQLVCVDRRYQRMNCFNVKELQSVVRKRFFFELFDNNVYNENLNNTLISLKKKVNNLNSINKNQTYNVESYFNKNNNFFLNFFLNFNINFLLNFNFTYLYLNFYNMVLFYFLIIKSIILNLFLSLSYLNISLLNNLFKYIFNYKSNIDKDDSFFFFNNSELYKNSFFKEYVIILFYKYFFNLFDMIKVFFFNFRIESFTNFFKKNFDENYKNLLLNKYTNLDYFNSFSDNSVKKNIENISNKRFLLFENPNIKFKVKVGNFLPRKPYETNFEYLLGTFNFKTTTGKNSLWLNSININNSLFDKFKTNNGIFSTLNSSNILKENLLESSFDFIFFFKNILDLSNFFIFNQQQWVSNVYFDNSFINIFINRNKQLFVWNNWKNLKLNREGWRCRLLVSRNQQSLFKKYIKDSELIWTVEKNAKDLIPGWAMITPFSSRPKYTVIGKTDIGLWVVVFTLLSSIISCSNFLITYRYLSTLNNRKMRDARSFFAETIMATCWMTILANPMLLLGILMLLSDRHWKTSFFDYSGGGDTVLFQHMFWFFGHPEVYIIIVPCFGFVNTILSFYLRKRISARASLMYSIYTIAFLGFFVWGHHMYMVGLAHTTRMLYSTLTVMISVPAATKLMHWFITFINSSLHLELPLVLILSFIFFFISGGISGMSVAHTGMDVLFHDTFFVVGHFHVMLAGSLMFAGFAGIYFYLPAIFGVRYNRFFAYLHYIYYTIGQLFTVIPMMWLGYSGMPRRVLDYPSVMGGWHSLSTSSHILSIAGILCFIFMLFDSLIKKKAYILKTFGVGRYNTRLNFYLYECSRNSYWRKKYEVINKNKNYFKEDYTYDKIKNHEIYDTSTHYYIIK